MTNDDTASAPPAPTPEAGSDLDNAAYWKRQQADWLARRTGEGDEDWIARLRRHFHSSASPPPGEDLAGQGEPVAWAGVSLVALHAANIARQAEWCPDQLPDLSFRGNELAGETGEACNVIKKLERERHGWRGSRATKEQLAEELADVVICADLCAVTAGINLDAAVRDKFNATSEKVGLTTKLAAPAPSRPADRGLTEDDLVLLLAREWVNTNGGDGSVVESVDDFMMFSPQDHAACRKVAAVILERLALRDAPRTGGDGTQDSKEDHR